MKITSGAVVAAMAAQWGSFMRAGDPGACMYGFKDDGKVQNEAHRKACLDYIDTECRPAADLNVAAGEGKNDHAELVALREWIANVPAIDPERPTYYECGICGTFHSARWNGDCRENGARFNYEDLDLKHGERGWDEIEMDAVDAFQAGQGIEIGPEDFAGKTY